MNNGYFQYLVLKSLRYLLVSNISSFHTESNFIKELDEACRDIKKDG